MGVLTKLAIMAAITVAVVLVVMGTGVISAVWQIGGIWGILLLATIIWILPNIFGGIKSMIDRWFAFADRSPYSALAQIFSVLAIGVIIWGSITGRFFN